MIEAVEKKKKRAKELEAMLADPQTLKDMARYQAYAKELSLILPYIKRYDEYLKARSEIEKTEAMLKEKHDKDFIMLARQELEDLKNNESRLLSELEDMLIDESPDSNRDVIMEIRAGTGGLEASLFAGELFRMYSKYAQSQGWKVDIMNTSGSDAGGLKEVVFEVSGSGVYKKFRYESGVHRVQRVPETEASGRIHTSAVTVAVLPEAEEVEINIDPKDLKTDVYRATGKGGQGVNTTDSAVRITHAPTGIVVTCQDERSQLKNKIKAMKVLRSRIYEKLRYEQESKISKDRKSQIGSGDRSEKIRTYNFPDRRVTDHRIGLTIHNLPEILEGKLEEIISALILADRKAKLEQAKG